MNIEIFFFWNFGLANVCMMHANWTSNQSSTVTKKKTIGSVHLFQHFRNNQQQSNRTYQFQHCAHFRSKELQLSVQVHDNGYTCLRICSYLPFIIIHTMFDRSTNRRSALYDWTLLNRLFIYFRFFFFSISFSCFTFDVDIGFRSKMREVKSTVHRSNQFVR